MSLTATFVVSNNSVKTAHTLSGFGPFHGHFPDIRVLENMDSYQVFMRCAPDSAEPRSA